MDLQDGLGTPGQEAVELLVRGTVQGVGFRPFVYRLANRFGICGSVANNRDGVIIRAAAGKDALYAFMNAINEEAPPLARIDCVESKPLKLRLKYRKFFILESEKGGDMFAHITPDVATCQSCRSELLDPKNRRYGYPFINCTDCGPRYSIVEAVPYDRERTSMKAFQMCQRCLDEYHNPEDRRFHAEPNACWRCGPGLEWLSKDGERIDTPDPVFETVIALKQGKIAAIKGLGGFHLAVDAFNQGAVAELRARKGRPSKPLAVMAADIETARLVCDIDALESEVLISPERPIVLLKRRSGAGLSTNIAPGISDVGVMLPHTPLHHLIFAHADAPRIIVLTSGNLSGEPIVKDNNEALDRLSGIADFFLIHDREIVNRLDDSVVRQTGGRIRLIRRSRGYAPAPVVLDFSPSQIIALGGLLKNTFCLSKGRSAILSQHIGDLDTPEIADFFEETIGRLKTLFNIQPEAAACDMHPDYPSTRYAMSLLGLPVYTVQHHHAHAVSVMAEYGLKGPCIAVILDGAGLGPDRTVWGGEVLLADLAGFRRLGRLGHLLLPGGDAAAREPWRMAMSAVFAALGPDGFERATHFFTSISSGKRDTLTSMLINRINTPLTSSCGRLFDAVSALLGICLTSGYEGQAAMGLEAISLNAIDERETVTYPIDIREDDGLIVLDHASMIRSVLRDIEDAVPPARIGFSFHIWLVNGMHALVKRLAEKTGIKDVVLGGGCMQNKIILEGLIKRLGETGLVVYAGESVPANDGGLSLGQLVIGGARHVSGHTNGGR